jgi:chromosome segregation ATPase
LASFHTELEKRLEQAQHEIDELELQVVPAELRDIHQALFSANQDLEEKKRANEKLNTELEEANTNVVRAQEDSSQLLIKISQLQDTIAYVD